MEFYRVEYLIENFKKFNKEENEKYKAEEESIKEKYDINKIQSQQNKMLQNYIGKNNNLKDFSSGNFKIPKFKI